MDDYSKAQKMEDMQEWLEILLPFLIVIAIAVIVGLIIGVSILAVKKKHQENALYGDESGQSVSQENAKVVSKRTARTNIAGVVQDVGFITFEFDNGMRKEFAIKDDSQFGMIIQHDRGVLSYI